MGTRKLLTRQIGACAVLVGGLLLAGGPVRAACLAHRSFSSVGYVYTPGACDAGPPCGSDSGSSVTSSLQGVFWRIGFGNPLVGQGIDNGTFSALEDYPGGWIYTESGGPAGIVGDWAADAGIDGCIDVPNTFPRCMAIALSDQHSAVGYFALLSAEAGPSLDYDFQQPNRAPMVLGEIPRPVVLSAQAGGPGHVLLTVRNAAVPAGALDLDGPSCDAGLLTGYRVYQQRRFASGQAPVDRDRALWQLAPGGAGAQGQPIPLGTSAVIDVESCGFTYLALALTFDSGFETRHVSRSTPIAIDSFCPDHDCDGWPGFCEVPEAPLDCDDGDPGVYPGAPQVCDGRNNDCDHSAWPDLAGTNEEGEDLDGDVWTGACDNCPATPNPAQGNADTDAHGDACDNCPFDSNPGQSDVDADEEGNRCDLDDGLIELVRTSPFSFAWQEEFGVDWWNVYRGDLAVLRASGIYTQGSPLFCGLTSPVLSDPVLPQPGRALFYLASGVTGGVEGGLGQDSTGVARPNDHPCP